MTKFMDIVHRVPNCLELARNQRWCKGAEEAHERIIELEGKLALAEKCQLAAQNAAIDLTSRLHQLSEDHSHCEGLLHELGERASRAEGRLDTALAVSKRLLAWPSKPVDFKAELVICGRNELGDALNELYAIIATARGLVVERGSTIEAGPEFGDAIRRVIEIEQATRPKSE